uniref:Uncharacterized protein n=1 Tax=Knipowitschia caucasica TaxID=637954 RepID=A0AAV2M8F2_KNICA
MLSKKRFKIEQADRRDGIFSLKGWVAVDPSPDVGGQFRGAAHSTSDSRCKSILSSSTRFTRKLWPLKVPFTLFSSVLGVVL